MDDRPPVTGKGIAALALALAGFIGFGPLCWTPALFLGRAARRDVEARGLAGGEAAVWGYRLAAAGLVVFALIIVAVVIAFVFQSVV